MHGNKERSQQGETLSPLLGGHLGKIMGEAGGAADGTQKFLSGQHLWKGGEKWVVCWCAVVYGAADGFAGWVFPHVINSPLSLERFSLMVVPSCLGFSEPEADATLTI
jgi:hypothetical protein